MQSRQFVVGLREEVVEANLTSYRQLFANTSPTGATDPYWREALALYAHLNEDQREVLFKIIRQVVVDTTSSLLAVLDGVSRLRSQKEAFTLRCGDDRLDGDLQDQFLELEEND